MGTIGVVGICRNAERDIRGFLNNLLPWVDEVVLVDDGSTDATVEIACAAGPKVRVIHHPMGEHKDFAGQRNIGIEASTADWLLHVDMDERISHELREEIQQLAADSRGEAGRYRMLNFFLHHPMKGGAFDRWNQIRFARRDVLRFEQRLHERPVLVSGSRVIQFDAKIWHLNDDSYEARRRKSAQYSALEAEKLLASGLRVRWWHLAFRPIWLAFKRYVLLYGFRDGVPGLIWAYHSFSAEFHRFALVWDRQNTVPRDQLERRAFAAGEMRPSQSASSAEMPA